MIKVNFACSQRQAYGGEQTRTNPGHFAREGLQGQRRCGQKPACHPGICFDGGICKETSRKPHTHHHKYCQTAQQGHSGIPYLLTVKVEFESVLTFL